MFSSYNDINLDNKTKEIFSSFPHSIKFGLEHEFYIINKITPEQTTDILSINMPFGAITKERGIQQFEYYSNTALLDEFCSKVHKDIEILEQKLSEMHLKAIDDPKPFVNDYGSALQISVSIKPFKEELFFNWLYSMLDLSLEGNYLINKGEYKRLIPHFMAPTHICWGINNRTTLIRVPKLNCTSPRIEFRLPNSNAKLNDIIKFLALSLQNALENKPNKYEPIWGNAFDPQYKLRALLSEK